MTNATIITRTVTKGEDRFAVVVGGQIITSHPTLRGAEKLAARYNETGAL